MDGDRFIVRNLRLRNLIVNACQLRPPQLVGGPGWVNPERVDIDARTDPGATNAEKWAMVRRLLAWCGRSASVNRPLTSSARLFADWVF
jgi:uncharacterized protein (TIGR03435 family)